MNIPTISSESIDKVAIEINLQTTKKNIKFSKGN